MPGHLFTQYFLTDGIRQTPERQSQRSAFAAFRDEARRLFQAFPTAHNPNETQTEQDLIRPLLQLLGWTDDLPQQTTSGGEDIGPTSSSSPTPRPKPAPAVPTPAPSSKPSPSLSSSASAVRSTAAAPARAPRPPHPTPRLLRYLREAETVTDGDLRWGILTNGAVWRLYDQKTRPRATAFYEADLHALLQADDQDALRTFHLLFRRSAFVRRPGAAAAFLRRQHWRSTKASRYEQRVAQSLAGVVFERVYPRLLQALADADRPSPCRQIREAALIFLYRLLFVLYAEDRGLLPVNDADLRRLRPPQTRPRQTWPGARPAATPSPVRCIELLLCPPDRSLSRQIDQGDPSIGLPPYNGGLFAATGAAQTAEPGPPARRRHGRRGLRPQPHPGPTVSPATSTTATCPSSNSAPSTNACWNRSRCAAPTARSASAPTPTPARTAVASTPRKIWWTSSSIRPSKPLIEERLEAFESRAE